MPYNTSSTLDRIKFSDDFVKKTNLVLDTYQEALDQLEKISNNPNSYIEDLYGICNNRYRVRYITPSDIVNFVSYVAKGIGNPKLHLDNVNDMELFAVSLIERAVQDNKECVPFEHNTVYPTGTYMNPRNTTLDQLVLICRNEYFDTHVYSKMDMIQRAEAIKPIVALMNGIRFTSNVRKLVANIPDILSKQGVGFGATQKLLVEYIERFIQTACLINLATIEQLLAYCVPRTSYNLTKIVKNPDKRLDYDYYGEGCVYFSDGIVMEAVDLSKNSPVFINLSNGGNNFVSNTIRNVTHSDWSHASIGFDPHMDELFTMNGGPFKDNVYGKQKIGFQREALHSSKYNDIRVRVYCIFVPNETFQRMKEAVMDIEAHKPTYYYTAILTKSFNDNVRRPDSQYRQVCSSLVNSIIAVAGKPLSDKEIASPRNLDDAAMTKPDQVFLLYDGPGGQYDYDAAMQKITNYARRESSQTYGESYVTECCMLRTNDMRIRGNIPFNCNMRDIVLQDVHPQFKDTKSALRFMMTDARSPIAILVKKYKTVPDYPMLGRILPLFAHYKPNDVFHNHMEGDDIRNKLGMHTDINWLDKITYGNQWLDANYRSDAMGNNKFSPIEQSLDALYRMFSPTDLKTNEDLANNVFEVACAMDDLLHEYNGGMENGKRSPVMDNCEMFRDIMAVLGEILTRSMLKLFYNNMQFISASDDMADAGGPGYMYTEGFVMEADEKPAADAKKGVGVTVVQKNGQAQNSKTILQKIADILRKFTTWLSTTFANIVGKFSNDHRAEISWVEKNKALNDEIGTKLGNNEFAVKLNNFPDYNVQIDKLRDIKIADGVKALIESDEKIEGTKTLIAKSAMPEALKTALQNDNVNNNKEAMAKAVSDFVLYGTTTPKALEPERDLTQALWQGNDGNGGIVNDIVNTTKALQESVKSLSDDMKNAKNALDAALKEAAKPQPQGETNKAETPKDESADSSTAEVKESTVFDFSSPIFMEAETQPNADKAVRLQSINSAFLTLSQVISTQTINTIIRKFYSQNYKVYRDIVNAYKSQSNTQEQPKNEETPAEPVEKPVEPQAESNTPAT